ncbi:hypothetical protein ACS0TY_018010 [Phlomoides rotata]
MTTTAPPLSTATSRLSSRRRLRSPSTTQRHLALPFPHSPVTASHALSYACIAARSCSVRIAPPPHFFLRNASPHLSSAHEVRNR